MGLKTSQKIYLPFKRLFDIFFSFVLILFLIPLFILTLIINSFFTKFHPIFLQKRCGRNLKPFTIIKFRTLNLDAPKYQETCSEIYYTKIGFFLRKSHIDEIPQLFNIFLGQMSFIGPRPIILTLTEQIEKRIEDQTIGLLPGLTGLAQVNERKRKLTQMEKCRFDKVYLDEISFKTDFKIVFLTISILFVNLFSGNE